MYDHSATFLTNLPEGACSPGIFLVSQERYSIGQMIGFLVEIYDLSSHEEWRNLIVDLPL